MSFNSSQANALSASAASSIQNSSALMQTDPSILDAVTGASESIYSTGMPNASITSIGVSDVQTTDSAQDIARSTKVEPVECAGPSAKHAKMTLPPSLGVTYPSTGTAARQHVTLSAHESTEMLTTEPLETDIAEVEPRSSLLEKYNSVASDMASVIGDILEDATGTETVTMTVTENSESVVLTEKPEPVKVMEKPESVTVTKTAEVTMPIQVSDKQPMEKAVTKQTTSSTVLSAADSTKASMARKPTTASEKPQAEEEPEKLTSGKPEAEGEPGKPTPGEPEAKGDTGKAETIADILNAAGNVISQLFERVFPKNPMAPVACVMGMIVLFKKSDSIECLAAAVAIPFLVAKLPPDSTWSLFFSCIGCIACILVISLLVRLGFAWSYEKLFPAKKAKVANENAEQFP